MNFGEKFYLREAKQGEGEDIEKQFYYFISTPCWSIKFQFNYPEGENPLVLEMENEKTKFLRVISYRSPHWAGPLKWQIDI